ncbi:hypothetical protein VP1G_03584 [Cytospora mali]|uniref:Uncharacterized protein n=1 Tax=Cytospora mali TaxID=578113 RepID=A0A194UWX4_CYTMA|nr:hypothetical protein VP1G_03584 [Valsa mali var. pyri (nom. inval.)]
MGRSRWPPNSFSEWVVGQNFKNTPQRSSSQTPLLTVSISEDEASGNEKVEITYPRRRRINRPTTQPPSEALASRRVRFDRNSRPLKSALKKRADIDTSSDTLVEDSSEEPTTEEESSAVEDNESSEDEAYARRKRLLADKKLRAAVFCRKKNNDSEDSSGVEDDLPHPTCRCMDCVKGRRVLKGMSKLDLKPEASSADATSTEANETTQTEDSEGVKEGKKVSPKQNNKKLNSKANKKASPKATEPPKPVDKDAFKLTKYPKSMEPNLIMPVRSKVLQCEHTIEGPRDPRPNAFVDSGKGIVRVYHGPTWGNHTGELYGSINPAKMPSPLPSSVGPYPGFHGYPPGPHGYPPGAPGYYGPPPYGPYPPYPPRPHAGPSPRFPAGPPPGSPFAKNMPPAPPNGTSVKNVQMPDNTATKEPATKAMGISGNAWPGTPALLREAPGQGQQEKAKSEAADNVGPSQGSGSQKGSQNGGNARWDSSSNQNWGGSGNQAWGEKTSNSPADFSGWGGNKGGFERTSNKSDKSAIGSQKGAWLGKLEKKSPVSINDSPIHEGGNNGWGDSGNKGWGASENSGWGESGNKDWKDSGDKGWTNSGGNGWGKSGDNGWKSSPVATASPKSNKPPSTQPWGLPEDGGGSKGWGDKDTNQGDNQGWGTQEAGKDTWKDTSNSGNDIQKWNSGSTDDQGWNRDKTNDGGGWYQDDANKSGGWDNNKVDTGGGWSNDKANGAWNDVGSGPNRNSPQGGPGGNVWGGPPHSRPSSQGPSDERRWGNSGRNSGNGNDNGNDNNVVPGPMPGAWVDNYGNQHPGGGSNRPSPPEWDQNQNHNNRYNNDNNGGGNTRRVSPKETYVGAFDWPDGQDPPPGSANHRWNGNGGYNGPRSSPANNWKSGNGGNGSNGTRDKPPTPPDPSATYQFGSGGYGGSNQQQYGDNNGRHVTGWKAPGEYAGIGVDDNPSNNAGPTNHSWANPSLAQDTGGKADNW